MKRVLGKLLFFIRLLIVFAIGSTFQRCGETAGDAQQQSTTKAIIPSLVQHAEHNDWIVLDAVKRDDMTVAYASYVTESTGDDLIERLTRRAEIRLRQNDGIQETFMNKLQNWYAIYAKGEKTVQFEKKGTIRLWGHPSEIYPSKRLPYLRQGQAIKQLILCPTIDSFVFSAFFVVSLTTFDGTVFNQPDKNSFCKTNAHQLNGVVTRPDYFLDVDKM